MARVTETLDQRIATVLNDDSVSSTAIQNLYEELAAAIPDAQAKEAEARARSLDPVETDHATARTAALDYHHQVERLQAALPRLADRLAIVSHWEDCERWEPQFKALQEEGVALAAELKTYPEIANKLADLFQRIKEYDQRASAVNITAPQGEHRRLSTIEQVAGRENSGSVVNPSLLDTVKLPDFLDASEMAWPKKQIPWSIGYSESIARSLPPHPGADWWKHTAAQDAARVEESQRALADVARRSRELEERENAKVRAQQRQMMGG